MSISSISNSVDQESHDDIFNFADAEKIMSTEDILDACFANPERKKFPTALWRTGAMGENPLCSDEVTADMIFDRVNESALVMDSVQDFNNEGIAVYDTTRLYENVDKDQWVSSLKDL